MGVHPPPPPFVCEIVKKKEEVQILNKRKEKGDAWNSVIAAGSLGARQG